MTSHNFCHFLIPILFDTLYSTFNTVVTKSTTLSIFSKRNIQKGSNYFASENEGEAGQQQLLQVLNKKSRRLARSEKQYSEKQIFLKNLVSCEIYVCLYISLFECLNMSLSIFVTLWSYK